MRSGPSSRNLHCVILTGVPLRFADFKGLLDRLVAPKLKIHLESICLRDGI